MNLLITAGNTLTLIDKVRGITNIFTGRTGTAIAVEAYRRGHRVTLLTSHPERIDEMQARSSGAERLQILPYQTFEELQTSMERQIVGEEFDAVVHCAAVSDYRCAGVYAAAEG